MFKKLCYSLPIAFILVFSLAMSAFAATYNWSTSVDVPFSYTGSFSTGSNGVSISGTQNVARSSDSIRYVLVKEGWWSDTEYDAVQIVGNYTGGTFSAKLYAPAGSGYKIKIVGHGVETGKLNVNPF